MTELVAEIASASSEQARGIDQVNLALTEMDKVTQQNAANAEESAAASEELRHQAQSVESLTGELMVLLNGAAKASNMAARPAPLQLEQPAGDEADIS